MKEKIRRPKVTKTITINRELLEWIEKKIEEREFASVSHCVEKAIFHLKREYEQKGENES